MEGALVPERVDRESPRGGVQTTPVRANFSTASVSFNGPSKPRSSATSLAERRPTGTGPTARGSRTALHDAPLLRNTPRRSQRAGGCGYGDCSTCRIASTASTVTSCVEPPGQWMRIASTRSAAPSPKVTGRSTCER